MNREVERTRNIWSHSLFFAVGLLTWAGIHSAVGATAETEGTYTWHAELVAFDEAAGTVTVKSHLVSNADIEAATGLTAGDRAVLTWSGISWAAGVRRISPESETQLDRMTMPVEFVATDDAGQYVTFRVPIPRQDVPKIAALEVGQWVTAISPHQPSGWDETVTAIRAYTDVADIS